MWMKRMLNTLVTRIVKSNMVDMRVLSWNKKALQIVWMTLLFMALVLVVKEPIGLITSPTTNDVRPLAEAAPLHVSLLAANQQIGSIKEFIMMNSVQTNKWIVVDGLNSECSNVTSFTQMLEWRVIVVVSKSEGYITGCRFPRCVIISEQNLEVMLGDYTVTQMMKKPTKLSGYLFAIQQGADMILDTTCDTQSDFNTDFPAMKEPSDPYELLHNESTIFNPFQHYGFEDSVYSNTLSDLRDNLEDVSSTPLYSSFLNYSDIYYLQQLRSHYIKQGVSGCYASCIKKNTHYSNPGFNSKLPVSIGIDTVGILDTGPTVFDKNAFISMFVPSVLPLHQHNIFRSLFVHGLRSFTPAPIRYYPIHESSHCACSSGDSSNRLRLDPIQIKTFLRWVKKGGCNKYTEVVHCTMDVLSRVLNILQEKSASNAKWKRSIRAFLFAWLDDLTASGLDDVYFESDASKEELRYVYDANATKMHYAFHLNSWKTVSTKQKNQLQKNVFNRMNAVCGNISKVHPPISVANWRHPMIEDVMLIVIINYESLFTTTPYLEYMHRYFFRYIAYCGPGVDSFQKYAKDNGFTHVTYISGLSNGWKYMYDCTTSAMRLGMPVRGYLQIGDDTLIDSYKLNQIQKDFLWLPGGYDKKNFYEIKVLEYWGHWQYDHGRPAILNIFNELYNVSMTDASTVSVGDKNITVTQEYRSFVRRFLQTYDKNIGVRNAVHRAIDIFYIPEIVKSDFLFASDLFMRHRSIIELAVPMIEFGLLPRKQIQFLKGASLWRQDRLKPWLLYDVEAMSFLHPFKSLLHLNQQEGQDFFCEAFLPKLFNYTFVGKL